MTRHHAHVAETFGHSGSGRTLRTRRCVVFDMLHEAHAFTGRWGSSHHWHSALACVVTRRTRRRHQQMQGRRARLKHRYTPFLSFRSDMLLQVEKPLARWQVRPRGTRSCRGCAQCLRHVLIMVTPSISSFDFAVSAANKGSGNDVMAD
jgi:NADH:ubiquinone oxidoreductase subunit